jgi:uncharacterized caspase-like protein
MLLRTMALVFLLSLLPSHAQSEERIALLIGNQGYNAKVGLLTNPHKDIALVGAALEKLGFKTTLIKDADYRSIDAAIKRHISTVRHEGQGTVSFVYYSGHGAADPDTKINYLIPVDVANADDDELWNYSLNLNIVVEGLRAQAPNATHYVVFDACRNELNLTRKGKKALADKGFVPIAYTPGVMVAYATAPGQTAAEGGPAGGPYAKALAEEIVKPGVEAMTMFRHVALRVKRELGQDPWMSASTLPEVYFAGALPEQEEETFWKSVKDSTDPSVLATYLQRYPNGEYATIDRLLIEHYDRRIKLQDAAREEERKRQEEERKAAEVKRLEEERRAKESAFAGERKRAEEAKNAEEAKRLEEMQRAELIARTEQLRKAQEEARVAREAAQAAKLQLLAANRDAAEATKAAEKAIATKKTRLSARPKVEKHLDPATAQPPAWIRP